ncbi:hypothetical protein [Nitrosomonas sp.]|uniref:hypothetical protein n=1 Tax=Nitrosomonas sp. TaxID=42353 RepID=UPI0025E46F41|nr:hypothetical protein [Nitrosomonas sp.]MBV6448557.1 hypothetical protein [Nitrosomonas sp.]
MTGPEATTLWNKICDAWGWDRSSERRQTWLDRLTRWDVVTGADAVDLLIDTAQRQPTVAMLNTAVADVLAARAREAVTRRDQALAEMDTDPATGQAFVSRGESARCMRAATDWLRARPTAPGDAKAWRDAQPIFGVGHPQAARVAPILDDCSEDCDTGWVTTDVAGHHTVRPCGHCRPAAFEAWDRGRYLPGATGPRR